LSRNFPDPASTRQQIGYAAASVSFSQPPKGKTMNFRTLTSITVLAVMTSVSSTALAEDEYNVSSGYTADGAPLGVHGVDTVALSSLNAVAEGDAQHTVVHDGVAYYFSSATSAAQFEQNPDRYLPLYGGYCAYAVALGKKLDGDPHFADIVDGKLYLFVNEAVFKKYLDDRIRTLRRAERKWPDIHHTAVEDL
jgi:YHS domain-containing protein